VAFEATVVLAKEKFGGGLTVSGNGWLGAGIFLLRFGWPDVATNRGGELIRFNK